MSKKSLRSWWRESFVYYPGLTDKNSEAFVESETGITKAMKVYCKECLLADIDLILEEDIRAVNEGRITTVRTEATIKDYCESIDCSEFNELDVQHSPV